MPKLFIVPTPIGNLEDITLRALKVLKSVDFILAEDTRTSGFLLKHFEINAKLFPFHKFNEHKQLESVIQRILAVSSVALVSDAGTPGISDPGFLIVRECIEKNIDVECLPGATALIPALVNSGLPTDRFIFEGFLPQKKGRQRRIEALIAEPRTLVFYESPHRLLKTLEQLHQFLGQDRRVAVSRELSKLHEENYRGTLTSAIKHFSSKAIKGEIVLVVEGFKNKMEEEEQSEEN
ncbi:MAG TPA: 16S rRNA (cytidine(1402)-2'-O)-methyltransferase [Marinilabiliales bacterium]|jgi:16S rRNA (cytidine1402-2'-O)-methyltransferase|nr:MAG: 16S rRNA (cytidine(1402)-2'-O)-methyltransferase [Bacteroidetes bacterium GWA2_40_14]OFX57242.1 MAG: 16S rRNA (cytidine(1402)-2'-O)-methyltransferase [Bacteroidetes bacterium GWC2_40_13]OFX72345.1 MAG: 16S rRNA (cytidine(1402)-2'-O)-methyltransferase [Bacteroidetes bacterium GWD2_40_43]OFX90408.1 MAG: 16S rRNA (cytidine(1402)-2'-O)-methyltransferase [Bacteroidetes bacterium GWE2_40_63]OFY17347.1 MAG: 16S rRNA (cytidine(1402)-2'-O)-methyltransferase [Bacteroidetes bacterium GWF2_40_13]O